MASLQFCALGSFWMITDELHDNSLTCWRIQRARRALSHSDKKCLKPAEIKFPLCDLTSLKKSFSRFALLPFPVISCSSYSNLSNCCRHKSVWPVNFTNFWYNFWRVFVVWPNCISAGRRFCGCWRGIFIVGGPFSSAFSPPSWKTIIKCNLSERQQRSN